MCESIKLRFFNERGFTAVEAVVAIFILTLVIWMAMVFYNLSGRSAQYMSSREAVTFSAEQGIENFVDELRGNSSLVDMSSNSVTFVLDGETIEYSFNEGNKTLLRNNVVMVTGVEKFELTFLDSAGAGTVIPDEVKSVIVRIKAHSRGEELDLNTKVSFRTR